MLNAKDLRNTNYALLRRLERQIETEYNNKKKLYDEIQKSKQNKSPKLSPLNNVSFKSSSVIDNFKNINTYPNKKKKTKINLFQNRKIRK